MSRKNMNMNMNMNMKKFGGVLFVAIVFLLGVSLSLPGNGNAAAPGKEGAADSGDAHRARFRFGALDIKPSVEIGVTRDNNIFKTKTQKKSDTIMKYVPELKLILWFPNTKKSKMSLEFRYEIQDFDKFGAEDVENLNLKGGLDLERINGDWYSRTKGSWEDTSDPSSSETQTVTGPRTPSTKGELDTILGFGYAKDYRVAKLNIELSAGRTLKRYDRAAQNRLEHNLARGGLEVNYGITQKTQLSFVYEFERVRYGKRSTTDSKDDAREHSLRAGFKFHENAKISGKATVGAVFKLFDDKASDGSDRNTDGVSADVNLDWKNQAGTTKVNFNIDAGIDDASTPGQFASRNWKVGGKFTQTLVFLSKNLDAIITPSLTNTAFVRDSSNRKDKLTTVTGDLKYTSPSERFPWFASAGFKIERKTTNVNKSSVEYTNNQYDFKIGVVY